MPKRPITLRAIILPFLFLGTLQLSGCLQREIPPPDPGGAYSSTSGGGIFDQAPRLIDDQGQLIGYVSNLSFRSIVRPSHLPQTIYATAASQGVVVSEDNGQNWQRVNQPLPSAAAFVRLPNDVFLVAGTSASNEGVVIRSLDQGQSWERVLTIPGPAPPKKQFFEIIKPPQPPPVFVSSLVADPFNPTQVYATTSTGEVLLGEQSGKTWSTSIRISGKPDPLTGFINTPVRKIIPSPHSPEELMLITSKGKIIRTVGEEVEQLVTPKANIVDVQYVKQFPNSLILGTTGGVLVSRDRGATWIDLKIPISKTSPVQNTVVAISPTNPSRFLVGIDDIIFRSEDGGNTWHTLSLNLPNHIITDISIDPTNAANVILVTAPVKT